jgi:hypothetical protein
MQYSPVITMTSSLQSSTCRLDMQDVFGLTTTDLSGASAQVAGSRDAQRAVLKAAMCGQSDGAPCPCSTLAVPSRCRWLHLHATT